MTARKLKALIKKQGPSPSREMSRPASVGPISLALLNMAEFEGDGVAQVGLVFDHLHGEGLADGRVKGVDQAQDGGQES